MDERLAISLSHEIQELIQSGGWHDPDRFGLRLARELATHRSQSSSLPTALSSALGGLKTDFFRANEVTRSEFQGRLVSALSGQDVTTFPDVNALIAEFRAFAERQLGNELWTGRKDEGVLRSHLQTFLEAKMGGSYKEVPTGRGRTDIVLLGSVRNDVVEVKLWKGEQYFRDGLVELAEYLRTEQAPHGWCVVLDCTLENPLVQAKGETWTEKVDGRLISVHVVHIAAEPPSKLARARRSGRNP